MKRAVKDDPKKLHFDRGPEFPGIFPDPVNTDIDFPYNGLPGFGKGEGDNIRIEVVTKEFTVDFQQPVIGNKNVLEFGQFFSFFLKEGGKGALDPPAIPQANSLFKMKPNSRGDCHNFIAPR